MNRDGSFNIMPSLSGIIISGCRFLYSSKYCAIIVLLNITILLGLLISFVSTTLPIDQTYYLANTILSIAQTLSIVYVIIKPYIEDESRIERLKKGCFVGESWQKELFIDLVFMGMNQPKNQQKTICILDTNGWTEDDLSNYGGYSPEMIKQFYSNRDKIMQSQKSLKEMLKKECPEFCH